MNEKEEDIKRITVRDNQQFGKRVVRLLLWTIGAACVSGASIGVYALLSNNSLPATEVSAKGVDVADSFDFDCEAQEVIGEDDGNGVFCSEQKITGTLPSDGEVVLKDADKYEINGNNFTRTISYEFPQETYNAETLDIETVKAGQDDEIEITLLDGDTGEVLATKTVKVHYSISDEDVDKIIHYSITISNITVEQIQQVIVQNNPGLTDEDIEAIIRKRKQELEAEKEAKRLADLEKAKAEEARLAEESKKRNIENQVIRDNGYSAWLGMLCRESDYVHLSPVIDGQRYELKIGCAMKNKPDSLNVGWPNGSRDNSAYDIVDMNVQVLSAPVSNIVPPENPRPTGNSCNYDLACEENIEAWEEYDKKVSVEYQNQRTFIYKRMKLIHSMGSATIENGDWAFHVPKGASDFNIAIGDATVRVPSLLEWPLTYERILPYLPDYYKIPTE